MLDAEKEAKPSLKWRLTFFKHQIKRKMSFFVSSVKLNKADSLPVDDVPGELRLFAMGRNESLRLPYFLDYYLSKGVERIFFIDNNSTDDTAEIALAHDNVHVFRTNENFSQYSNWMEILLEKYGRNHWCMAADLDEIFYYPHAESLTIKELCDYLDGQDETAVRSVLLDMYSDKTTTSSEYHQGNDPLEVCPFFDKAFDQDQRQWLNHKTMKRYTMTRFGGNMRKRVFGQDANLTKIPLFKYGESVFLARGDHAIDGAKISTLQGAVLHFKYFQDFNARVLSEAERGQHEGGAKFYKELAAKIHGGSGLCLFDESSIEFKDSTQLVDLNIMKTTAALNDFIDKSKS